MLRAPLPTSPCCLLLQALEGPYGRGISAPALYPGEEPALPPEAIAAVDLGESDEEGGEGPPPLASPSPAGEMEEEEGEQAGLVDAFPATDIFVPPAAERQAAAGEEQPAGGATAAEGQPESAEARLKGLFAPVGAAAGAVGGFLGGGLSMAGAAAGGTMSAVAETLHIPGLSRARPEEPAVQAEAGATEEGAAEAEMQPPLAPAGAAGVEAEEEKPAAGAETAGIGPTAAAEGAAAVPAAAAPVAMPEAAAEPAAAEVAAVPPTWEHGSAAQLAGRSGERVAVQVSGRGYFGMRQDGLKAYHVLSVA